MGVFLTILLAIQILTALGMIGLILIQQGKGADMGAAFGSGSSGSLFGASGSANFLSRATGVLATVFFICTLALAYFGNARPVAGSNSVLEGAGAIVPKPQPAASGAQLIPAAANTNTAPASQPAATPGKADVPVPAIGASGAGQIPAR